MCIKAIMEKIVVLFEKIVKKANVFRLHLSTWSPPKQKKTQLEFFFVTSSIARWKKYVERSALIRFC